MAVNGRDKDTKPAPAIPKEVPVIKKKKTWIDTYFWDPIDMVIVQPIITVDTAIENTIQGFFKFVNDVFMFPFKLLKLA